MDMLQTEMFADWTYNTLYLINFGGIFMAWNLIDSI